MSPQRTHPEVRIVPISTAPLAAGGRDLVEEWLSRLSLLTRREYGHDMKHFAAFLGASSVEAVGRALLAYGQGQANLKARQYVAMMLERALSPSTINRRVSALRSFVTLARLVGATSIILDVKGVRSKSFRDTRGPGVEGVNAILGKLNGRTDPKALRDKAIIRVLFDLGLRCGEALALDLDDVDLEAGTVSVVGKGDLEPTRLTLPAPTVAALKAWIHARGAHDGALFTNFDRAGKGSRLTHSAVAVMLAKLGASVGVNVRPHGLRHAAVTAALDFGAPIRSVQRFARHASPTTTMAYDDNRADLAGQVAAMVASSVCNT